MSRVDFYVLREDSPRARWQFAGRLADKARRLGHRVVIAVDSPERADELDELLWAQPAESFLPHRARRDRQAPPAPVELATAEELGEEDRDVLINLCHGVPGGAERFERVAEIVIQSPEVLETTREHFRHYKAGGYAVHHQHL